ncbi:hypothetical protein PV327_000315 [Microctonus hyperodae]|uniref:Uncharacterized protein n=1 Tax=Microctonus hyperodae TaxID=165561 RepID=A0AA39G6D4_MICHY|nr:hypothetical protein PV327_000315 [Microctonus hyperodae]
MIEFVINKLFLPKLPNIDSTTIRETTVTFHIDDDWLSVTPQPKNDISFNGLINEEENFYGGMSVLFAIPAADLHHKISNAKVDVYVRKNASKYSEMQSFYNLGFTRVPIDSLFNGIVKDLKERKDMQKHFNYFHPRAPISRSMKDTYIITNDEESNNLASITIYTRLNYLGKSIITEIESFPNDEFHIREETCEGNPYQCREVNHTQLEIGYLDGDNTEQSPSVRQKHLICMDNMDILRGVKAEAKAALNVIEQKKITMNATGDIGKGKEFTTDNIGGITQEISARRSKDEKVTEDKKNKALNEADVGPHIGNETEVEIGQVVKISPKKRVRQRVPTQR